MKPVGLAVFLILILVNNSYAFYPWEYGFINANVSCQKGNQVIRMKFASEVFGLCPYELGIDVSQAILVDSRSALEKSVRAECGPMYKITNVFVDWRKPRQNAEAVQKQALSESGYSEHYQFASGEGSRYYTQCR